MKTSTISALFSSILATLSFIQYSKAASSQCEGFYSPPKTEFALWMEKDSIAREAWVRNQNGKTIQKLNASENYKPISDVVLSQNSKASTLSSDSNDVARYDLRFMGVGKPQSLFRTTKDGQSKTEILTTETLKKDTSFSLLTAFATPKDTHVITIATDNGSIDNYTIYIYDLAQKKVVKTLETSSTEISWKNDKEFYFTDNLNTKSYEDDKMKTFNLSTGKIETVKKMKVSILDPHTQIIAENGSNFVIRKGQPKLFLPRSHFNSDISIESISSRKNGNQLETYIHAKNQTDLSAKILKHTVENGKSRWTVVFESQRDSVIESVLFSSESIVVNTFWGASVVARVLNYEGKPLFELPTPECCSVSHIQYTPGKDSVEVTVNSHFKQNVTFEYSIKQKKFLDSTLEKQMMSFNGVDFTSAIHWATSKDGTKIPVRLTYRKDLPRNKDNGLLIYGYGGFNLPGYIRNFNPRMDAFFIKNGGIVASPALRGGNEFGPKWHESAMFENKNKTMEDFVAAAELVHSLELSRPEKTAIQGWSNGGFIAAATGLLYPHVIGIVVSGNGVNDQFRKEVMDWEFGDGWAYELGDSRKEPAKTYTRKWSPVLVAQMKGKTPNMLIANGRLDTRVDPAHSFKLALALKMFSSTPENVDLLSINNSGHWMTTVSYQNTIGWKAQTLIWTYLFDQMGMRAQF